MEDQKDHKIPASTPNPTEPVYAIEQWRQALQEMPEWDSLPDGFHEAILRRLKTRNFPTEPSGHASWKHVKMVLQQGKQPDWVNLITATFIWRVKRRRPDMPVTTALPDSFVSEAAFHTPPINITTWPTKGMPAAWQPKQEPIPQISVKSEDLAQNAPAPGLWAPKAPAAREATVAREAPTVPTAREATVVREAPAAPAAREPSAAPSVIPMPPPINGSTVQKRARPADQEDTTNRSEKRQKTTNRTGDETAAGTNDVDELKKKLADLDDKVADLIKELADTKTNLADNMSTLADTRKNLENTTVELGELRAIAMRDRRCIRRSVAVSAADARSREQVARQLLQEYDALAENMG